MELPERIEDINKRLIDHYGISTDTSEPIWRVVWSDDQFEKRFGTYDDITPNGLYIRTVTEVRLVPKYRQWIQHKYILERLVVVPDQNIPELPVTKMSYEPLWTFEDANENPLPPKWQAIELIIQTVYAAQYGTHNLKKFVDEINSQEAELDQRKKKVDEICEYLWGEQSKFSDGIKTGETIHITDGSGRVFEG